MMISSPKAGEEAGLSWATIGTVVLLCILFSIFYVLFFLQPKLCLS